MRRSARRVDVALVATATREAAGLRGESVRVHLFEEDLVPGAGVVGEVDAHPGVGARPAALAFLPRAEVPRQRVSVQPPPFCFRLC